MYKITGSNRYSEMTKGDSTEIFQLNGRYNQDRYEVILIDTGVHNFQRLGRINILPCTLLIEASSSIKIMQD